MSRIALDDSSRPAASSQLQIQPNSSSGEDESRHGLIAKLKLWASDVNAMTQELYGGTVQVGSSRNLTAADNGLTLECTASSVTLTVPAGLGANFGCAVIPKGTTSIASSGGALLNGSTSTVNRADTSNSVFALVSRASATDSYVVTGS